MDESASTPSLSGSPGPGTPEPEIEIDVDLVRRLLRAQHADLAGLEISFLSSGWDNELYRLGHSHVVRLPRRDLSAGLVRKECLWLPRLAVGLPIPVPSPVRIGLPSDVYPWWWSVNPYVDGDDALTASPADPTDTARLLGRFVAALRRPAPANAPTNRFRGVPLGERSAALHDRVGRLGARLDDVGGADAVVARWSELAESPVWAGPPSWFHGDIHPGNMIVTGGRVAAIVDFGDLGAGDPAVDLLVAWLMFGAADRAEFRAAAEADDPDLWRRGQAWGLAWSVAVLASSADRPDLAAVADAGLRATMLDT